MTRTKPLLRWAAAAASLLLLTACVPSAGDDGGSRATGATATSQSAASAGQGAAGSGKAMPKPPAGLGDFYTQDLDWTSCGTSFECSEVSVPLDYAHPDKDSIKLSVIRLEAGGDRQGSLLINPGGPGGSGVDMVKDAGTLMFSPALRKGYDLVGFDPRGVSRSAPVQCRTDAERDADRTVQVDTDTDAGLAKLERLSAEYAQDCARKTGASLGFVDTASAAKDLDILRAVNGDPVLNYLGYSYGTKLGATYASLFPSNTGRLVLDGAMDPSLGNEDVTLGQAKAFEKEIRAYLQDCLRGSDCPFEGTVDQALAQLHELFAAVEEYPLTAQDGREVTINDFVGGFIVPFYEDRAWPRLTSALSDAMAGDPTQMLELADLGAGRNEDGSYKGNSNAAFTAINCLDYPMDTGIDAQREDAKDLEKASPTLGKYLAFGGFACKDWNYKATGSPAPASAPGAAPIVIIGTTGDPATPYEWSQALNRQLESSTLVTYQGHGHTAYGRSNQCITKAVDNYFLKGEVPAEGLTC